MQRRRPGTYERDNTRAVTALFSEEHVKTVVSVHGDRENTPKRSALRKPQSTCRFTSDLTASPGLSSREVNHVGRTDAMGTTSTRRTYGSKSSYMTHSFPAPALKHTPHLESLQLPSKTATPAPALGLHRPPLTSRPSRLLYPFYHVWNEASEVSKTGRV